MRMYFDTETSGLPDWKAPADDPSQPFLVEFAAVLEDDAGKECGTFHALVQPPSGFAIPEEASKIHGITTDMAQRFGVPASMVTGFFMTMVPRVDELIAHNIKFDLRIMKIALLRDGVSREVAEQILKQIGHKTRCTVLMSTIMVDLPPTPKMIAAGFNRAKAPTLIEAYQHFFGKEFDGAHGALADVRACREVHHAILKVTEEALA